MLEASNLKSQVEAYLKLGHTPDQVLTLVLGNPQYRNLPITEKDNLSLQIQKFMQSRSVQAELVPVFPISTTKWTSDGQQKQIVNKDHPENMKFLIQAVMQLEVKLNILKNRPYINGRLINDSDISNIRNRCREYGLNSDKEFVIDVINEIANSNSYHPFLEIIEAIPWDGQDHIKKLFETLKIHPDVIDRSDWYYRFLRTWCVGAIAKMKQPGAQNIVLVLNNKQGDGKSRWIKKLVAIAPDIYGEGSINVDNKDHQLRHINYLFWHIPEMDGTMRRSDAALLKDFLTADTIAVREAYARFDRVEASRVSFLSSVNSPTFLVDETGSRRFLVLELDNIDADHTVDVLQVWAQALALFNSGERYYFNKEEIQVINEYNENYQTRNHVDTIASKVEMGDEPLTGVEIFAAYYGKVTPSQAELSKLGSLLQKKGIKRGRPYLNGVKQTVYYIKKPEKPIF